MNAIRKHASYFSRKNKATSGGYSVEDFTETKISLKKENTGLGISIVGGSDTYFEKILVTSINPESTAFKDGRLRIGDELLAVNGINLRGNPHEFAVEQIRLARSPVELTIFRENIEKIFADSADPNETIVVVLNKNINESLGLGIYARKDGKGVFITSVIDGSLASMCKQFHQGDQIINVNDKDLRCASQMEATQCLRNVFGTVRVTLGRNAQRVGTLQHFMYNRNTAERARKTSGQSNGKTEEPPFRSPRYRAKKTRPATIATDRIDSEDEQLMDVPSSCSPDASCFAEAGTADTNRLCHLRFNGNLKKLKSSPRPSSEPDIIDISVGAVYHYPMSGSHSSPSLFLSL